MTNTNQPRNTAHDAVTTAATLMMQGAEFELTHGDDIAAARFEDGMTLTVTRYGSTAHIAWAEDGCEPHLTSTAEYELGAILRRIATDLI